MGNESAGTISRSVQRRRTHRSRRRTRAGALGADRHPIGGEKQKGRCQRPRVHFVHVDPLFNEGENDTCAPAKSVTHPPVLRIRGAGPASSPRRAIPKPSAVSFQHAYCTDRRAPTGASGAPRSELRRTRYQATRQMARKAASNSQLSQPSEARASTSAAAGLAPSDSFFDVPTADPFSHRLRHRPPFTRLRTPTSVPHRGAHSGQQR